MSPTGIYSEFPIQFSTSKKADALAYAALSQDRNIWRLELQSKTWKRVIASTGQDASPQISPAGDRVSFRSDRSGEEQLWVSHADGSNPVQITRGNMRPSVGRWSPDGKSLAFNNPQTAEIHIATEEPGKWVVRNTGARGVHPAFSRDGEWVFAGGSTVTRIPVAGGAPQVFAQTRSEALSVSPDGKYLYFVQDRNDTAVSRIALQTGQIEKVVDGVVPGCTSCWALGSGGIYYLGTDKQSFDKQALFFQALDRKGPARLVVEYPEPLWPQGSGPFALSPDGRYLYCVRVDPSNSDVMLVAPFR
jgi:dipeptidyl aminopeptidase/acylaminoacyl peptidase